MRRISVVLKIIARIVTFPGLILGFLMGVVGVGPEGFLTIGSRISSLCMAGMAILFWLPNHRIRPYATVYLVITLVLTSTGLLVSCVYEIFQDGLQGSFVREAMPALLAGYFLTLSAPISLILYMKSEDRQQIGEQQTHKGGIAQRLRKQQGVKS